MNKKLIVLLGSFLVLGSFGLAQFTTRTTSGSNSAEVLMKLDSFEPEILTVKKGTTVTFKNEDTARRWPASNLHPTHDIYSAFDPQKPIDSGESWQFRFDEKGTWKYHDHLIPYIRGVITVED